MRYIWMIFTGLLVAMVAVLPRLGRRAPVAAPPAAYPAALPPRPASLRTAAPRPAPPASRADSIVAFGLAQQGTPYVYAGTSPLTGFDCSGFIMYTFAHFGVPVPHSTALLIGVGRPVARTEARPGDIVVFTGTAPTSTSPGHAGIVVSRPGEIPLRFVHASSSRREPFVKVSQVEGSDYERRFLQVRRVLGPGTGIVAAARPTGPPAVAPLRARPVPVAAALPTVPLPRRLATRPQSRRAPTASWPKAAATTAAAKKKAASPQKRRSTAKGHPSSKKRQPAPAKKRAKKPQ